MTLAAPVAVALNGEGDLYVADYALGEVIVVPADPAIKPYKLADGGLLQHPTALAIDAAGDLFVGDAGPAGLYASSSQPGYIVKIPASGLTPSIVSTSPVTVVFPQALTLDSAGDLYIADGGDVSGTSGQVVLVPQGGAAASVVSISGLSNPTGIIIDPAGQVYVLDAGDKQITVLPPNNGTPFTMPVAGANLLYPSFMAFTAGAKNILITDLDHGPPNNQLVLLTVSQSQLAFPTTALNTQSAPLTATTVNIGNLPLAPSIPGGSLYSFGGNTGDFQVQTNTGCFTLTELLPAQSCSITASFFPVSAGAESESITSTFNSYNQTQLLLTGTTSNSSSVAATPTFSPGSGNYIAAQSVTITDITTGAVIHYTLNGSVPTASSPVYSGPISVSGTTTINAIAVASGYTNSPVGTATYTYASSPYLGNNEFSTAGTDTANYINSVYAVTGIASGGYTVTSCSFYQPTGTVTAGKKIDCGIILAPSPTTQASSWLCHATYTNPGASGVGAWITLSLSGCGTLPAGTAYWIATDNNDPLSFPYGFWNCGGTCNGSAPTVGNGTYPYRYIAATYGTYTGMATSLLAGGGLQPSQYVTLTPNSSSVAATPTFSPGSGSYTSTQSVTISDSTPGAVIYYTADGSTPSPSSPVYSNPISISGTTTIKAIAVASSYAQSAVGSATYSYSLGNGVFSRASTDTANYINSVYAVTGTSSGGYTVSSCSFYQPSGTVTAGAKMDCGVISAPSSTTQASSWLCHATYTNPTAAGAAAWITLPLSGCGTLPTGTAYWIATDSNDHLSFPYGVWDCGSTCNGAVPTVGNGTYPYRYIAATYGTYVGMGTSMLAGGSSQPSQYVTLLPSSVAAAPIFSPGSGNYTSAQSVTISDTTPGAVIYYTVDGSTPTTSSSIYDGAISVSATTTINAIAVASGFTNSPMTSATYTFYLGNNSFSFAGTDNANYINAGYAVTGGSSGGYTVSSCSFYQPAGTVTAGAKVDCGLISAPTPTTQSSSWLCHATYTNLTGSGAAAWITLPLSGCGTLPADTAYWIATDSNDTVRSFPYGLWNCGGTCNGSAPTIGNGTYPYRYIAATYGVYTGMATAMNATTGYHASQYVSLTPVP